MIKLWQKPVVKEILSRYGKTAKKSLGQNYLLDYNVLRKIVEIVSKHCSQSTTIEIGPGLGGLTQAWLLETTYPLVVVEIDSVSCAILNDYFLKSSEFPNHWKERLTILHSDIKEVDLTLASDPPYFFMGNLPYHLASSIIIDLLERYQHQMEGGIFMVQKELYDRMVAPIHSHDFSMLSVLIRAWGEVKKLISIPPHSFYPIPKVDSVVIETIPHTKSKFISDQHYHIFKIIIKAAFQHRRKRLDNSLKLALEKNSYLSEKIKINFHDVLPYFEKYREQRAQNLSVDQYLEIAAMICQHQQ